MESFEKDRQTEGLTDNAPIRYIPPLWDSLIPFRRGQWGSFKPPYGEGEWISFMPPNWEGEEWDSFMPPYRAGQGWEGLQMQNSGFHTVN
ncbi:hypothetical protein DPMN_024740 [Dreissena polymorpha]|uniref:Uncharacterized protein n=1 Tax=Dreissena polymorpha TaxID=45954 RepID=A0A9D4LPG4_DREPO|nr:hypothetical protein DPMN_024740 [Dreissena polymorpha]